MILHKQTISLEDIQGIYVSDYDRPDLERIGKQLNLEDLLQSDETVRRFSEETGNPNHYMVRLRKREIILDLISPMVQASKPIEVSPTYVPPGSAKGKEWTKTNQLTLFGMYIATDLGDKLWSVDYRDLRQMGGQQRLEIMRRLFEEDKLRLVSSYERQTGNTTFGIYKANKGELTEEEYKRVKSYQPNPQDLQLAEEAIGRLPIKDNITDVDKTTIAKLIGALGNRVPREAGSQEAHSMWLLAESYIMQANVHSYRMPKIQR